MPIPRAYEALADGLASRFRLILYVGVGGFLALLVMAGLGAGLGLTLPGLLYEAFRIAARAMAVLSWLLSWFCAFLIAFGVVAVGLSLVLT